jgi:hypothetical protein
VFTDALKSHEGLEADYVHQFVDHAVKYAEGKVHTNLENFWSLLERSIYGTYVPCCRSICSAMWTKQAFRFNYRKEDDSVRFRRVQKGCGGRRLTYPGSDRQTSGRLNTGMKDNTLSVTKALLKLIQETDLDYAQRKAALSAAELILEADMEGSKFKGNTKYD